MRQQYFTLFAFALAILCINPLLAQRRGNGKVTKQDRMLSGFQGIQVGGAFDVYVKRGPFAVAVEADENLHEVILTEVKDGVLIIHTKSGGIRRAKEMKVYVSMPELVSLDVSGAADVEGEGIFKTGEMEISLSGASDVELMIDVDELALSTSGASDIALAGRADKAGISLSGSSDLSAKNMVTQVMAISQSGSSDAIVHCEGAIEATLSGSSDMHCYGKPGAQQVKTSGASSAVMQ